MIWNKQKPSGIAVKDIASAESKGIKISYSRLKKAILECELHGKDAQCKRELESIGIQFLDE